MQIEPLTRLEQIKEGDLLLISDGKEITHAKVQAVKVSEHDGTEVIFNLRKNKFFNVGMYLEGRSWAKEVLVVRLGASRSERIAVLASALLDDILPQMGRICIQDYAGLNELGILLSDRRKK